MRSVVQRVSSASVRVADQEISCIGRGLLVLLGVHRQDTLQDVSWMANKCVQLRIFEDSRGRMNRSLLDCGGEMLVVSQFTLLGDCRRGRRPSWSQAAPPESARRLYEQFVGQVASAGVAVRTGQFQAEMAVTLVNDGPVTILLDSHRQF